MKHVIFSPWVGKHYHTGWNGKRMMVLGESHYCASSEEAVPQITNRTITDLMDADSEHEGYKNTYTKFANALAGKFLSFDERKRLWHSVLFYNYVQVPMSGARIPPTTQEFAQSETAFFEVLVASSHGASGFITTCPAEDTSFLIWLCRMVTAWRHGHTKLPMGKSWKCYLSHTLQQHSFQAIGTK